MQSNFSNVPRRLLDVGYGIHVLLATIDDFGIRGASLDYLFKQYGDEVDWSCGQLQSEATDEAVRAIAEDLRAAAVRLLQALRDYWQSPRCQQLLRTLSDFDDAFVGADDEAAYRRDWFREHSLLGLQCVTDFRAAVREAGNSLPIELLHCFHVGSCFAQAFHLRSSEQGQDRRLSVFHENLPMHSLKDFLRLLIRDFPTLAELDIELRPCYADDEQHADGCWIDRISQLHDEIAKRLSAGGSGGDSEFLAPRRPAYLRDHLWLTWAEEFGLDNKNVFGRMRDQWNALSDLERKKYGPLYKKVPEGKSGWDRVRKGIAAARQDQAAEDISR